jgi:hypothetical protein
VDGALARKVSEGTRQETGRAESQAAGEASTPPSQARHVTEAARRLFWFNVSPGAAAGELLRWAGWRTERMAKQRYSPELRRAILEIVDNQLRDGTPPETRATLDRLLNEGFSRERAIELIACVVSTEIYDVLKSGKPYQESRFVAGLQDLPRLPWEDTK